MNTLSVAQPAWIQEVVNSYATDAEAHRKLQALAVVSPDDQGFELCSGIIKYNGKIWIGDNVVLQTKLISSFHCSAIGGHSGIKPTYQRVNKLFHWNGRKQQWRTL